MLRRWRLKLGKATVWDLMLKVLAGFFMILLLWCVNNLKCKNNALCNNSPKFWTN